MPTPVYLDNNATTRCDEAVVQAMLPFFTEQLLPFAVLFGTRQTDATDEAAGTNDAECLVG